MLDINQNIIIAFIEPLTSAATCSKKQVLWEPSHLVIYCASKKSQGNKKHKNSQAKCCCVKAGRCREEQCTAGSLSGIFVNRREGAREWLGKRDSSTLRELLFHIKI